MNKLDSIPPTLSLSPASHFDRGPARRLIVLVPESEADTANAARKIWELANALGSRVQFLGLSKDAASEPSLRRQMVTLSAMVGDGNVLVESKIEFGRDWLDMVKANWREGDVIACFAEQRAGLARRPLSQILESNLNATVYVLSGLCPPERSRSNRAFAAMAWTGSIGIILGFFWLQLKLTQLPQDWAHTSFLYLSILVEVGLIWMWNSLF
ncbi:MAG: hypothetical protein HZB19_21880 [Chloroflexi bacterium]|nr:hypothetical protein [Chloroflexota bacterium]